MDNREFKKIINNLALENGLEKFNTAWIKESSECILALILVKSNYSNQYYLNIKVNLRYAFGIEYTLEKKWLKHDIAHIFTRANSKFKDSLDLDAPIEDHQRKKLLENLFTEFVIPFVNKALKKSGIIELYNNNHLFLLDAVKKEIGII